MRKSALDSLFSKTRQGLLSAILLHPDKWRYLSDLAKQLNVSPSSLQRELASLVEGDLLETRKDGNRVYYRTNSDNPGVKDLQLLLIKTVGVADIVKGSLESLWEKIDIAFIYGSIARAEELALVTRARKGKIR
jgi:DNA-binding transcriptional ArsR family regulator